MPIHPVQELSYGRINDIKHTTKSALLKKALRAYRGTTPKDWLIRDTVFGDSTVTDFYDLDYLNAGTAGLPEMVIDAASLTADDLSSILASGQLIPDETFIGFYGFVDIGVECGELTGAADTPPNNGAFVSAQFKRGSSVLDRMDLEKLYGYPSVVGFFDRPMIYGKKDKIDIKVCATEDTEDKSAGFRGYTCELYENKNMRPDFVAENPLAGGIHPVAELSVAMIEKFKKRTRDGLYKMALKGGKHKTLADVKKNMIIREVMPGDDSNDTDGVDFDQSSTAQVTGQENWAQDSSVYTAGDLGNVFAAGEAVDDGKYVGIYGFFDKSANPNTIGIAFEDGAGRKDFWQPEPVYAYRGIAPVGLTDRPVFYTQNIPLKYMLNVKVARDNFVGLRAYILEDLDQVIS